MEFQDLMYQSLREPGTRNVEGAMAPAGIEVGLGVKPGATDRNFQQGSLQQTGNQLDMAIQGDGFFQIQLPDGGTAYTRDGTFKTSADGTVVTSSGFFLANQITIPQGATTITITGDGKVSADIPAVNGGASTTTDIGQIELARFVNPSGLKSLGGNLYAATDASGEAIVSNPGTDGAGTVASQNVEASNVQVVQEMVNMISAERAYEIISKTITIADQMMQMANNLKTA